MDIEVGPLDNYIFCDLSFRGIMHQYLWKMRINDSFYCKVHSSPHQKKTIEKKNQNTKNKPLGFLSCFIIILIFWVKVQIWRPLIFVLLHLIDFKKIKTK